MFPSCRGLPPPLPPPHVMTLKSPPNLNAPSGPINITTMIRQHTKFPPGRPTHRAIHCPTANFGQPSTCSITNPMLVTAFDTYLTQVTRSLVTRFGPKTQPTT